MKTLTIPAITLLLFVACTSWQGVKLNNTYLSEMYMFNTDSLIYSSLIYLHDDNRYVVEQTGWHGEVLNKVSGQYSIHQGKLHLQPNNINNEISVRVMQVLANKPVKIHRSDKQLGLQVKVDDVWYYFEQVRL